MGVVYGRKECDGVECSKSLGYKIYSLCTTMASFWSPTFGRPSWFCLEEECATFWRPNLICTNPSKLLII